MTKIDYKEYGSPGLETYAGFVKQAYITDLTWPAVGPLYSRLRRSDPEVTIVRNLFVTLARDVKLSWSVPDEYADDKRYQDAVDFGNSVLDDIDGGQDRFIETLISHVPFMGWGWWEVVPGVRSQSWRSPDDDGWKSQNNDNRIGFRRFAWRDTSSFYKWDMDDKTGRLNGFVQSDFPNPTIAIPLNRSLHITFGDPNNPEGLSPLEAVYRLERIKYGLEVINGIGFEHTAGYLSINAQQDKITESDKADIRRMVKAVLTAQESNYLALPKDVTAEFVDSSFQAAASLLEAIRYYGILKLMIFNAQWVALSSLSGSGSYAAMSDSSEMFINYYNAMIEGFVNQVDRQLGPRLFQEYNDFGLEVRPTLSVTKIEKDVDLAAMGQFLQTFSMIGELTTDDIEAIRKRSRFLPEQPTGDIISSPGSSVQQTEGGNLSQHHLSHDANVVNSRCPLCGNDKALAYPDHKGLYVCTRCMKTYDPSLE